jgi:Flp pilus assembly protein TadB
MPKKRRRRRPGATTQQAEGQPALGWEWRTFPVFFAFVAGLFIMGLVMGTIVGVVLFYLALMAVAFGLAHIFARWLALRRARREGQRRD